LFDFSYINKQVESYKFKENYKKIMLTIGYGLFHMGKLLFVLTIFGGFLGLSAFVAWGTGGVSLNASVHTFGYALGLLHIATPTMVVASEIFALLNVMAVAATTFVFGFVTGSDFIKNVANFFDDLIQGNLKVDGREGNKIKITAFLGERWDLYKDKPHYVIIDPLIILCYGIIYIPYLCFQFAMMGIPLRGYATGTIPNASIIAPLASFLNGITSTLSRLPYIVGSKSEDAQGVVQELLDGVKKTATDTVYTTQVIFEEWFTPAKEPAPGNSGSGNPPAADEGEDDDSRAARNTGTSSIHNV